MAARAGAQRRRSLLLLRLRRLQQAGASTSLLRKATATLTPAVVIPPAVIIRIEVEKLAPRLLVESLNESEHQRLCDWLETQPRLLKLVQEAIRLEAEVGSS